jgi:hypothetical protein
MFFKLRTHLSSTWLWCLLLRASIGSTIIAINPITATTTINSTKLKPDRAGHRRI